jgi:hypothetical protein
VQVYHFAVHHLLFYALFSTTLAPADNPSDDFRIKTFGDQKPVLFCSGLLVFRKGREFTLKQLFGPLKLGVFKLR